MTQALKSPLPSPPPQVGEGIVGDVDEFHGVGGSYILDPATGKRTRNQTINDPEIDSPAISNQKIDTSKKG